MKTIVIVISSIYRSNQKMDLSNEFRGVKTKTTTNNLLKNVEIVDGELKNLLNILSNQNCLEVVSIIQDKDAQTISEEWVENFWEQKDYLRGQVKDIERLWPPLMNKLITR